MNRRSSHRSSRRRGYTVVEVIMAIAVLGLGAAGVIAMQKATLIGNTNARNLATATTIAQSWIERLRLDAQAWNEAGGSPDLSTDTLWINTLLSSGTWTSPALAKLPGTLAGAPGADIMSADYVTGESAPAYCTQIRLTRLTNSAFTNGPTACQGAALTAKDSNLCTLYRMVRVEVRVYWDKSMRQIDCSTALPATYELSRYGFVYMVSGLLENNSPL